MRIHFDIETRSFIDLRKTGVYVYARHPSTDVLLARFACEDGEPLEWRLGQPCPDEIRQWVAEGATFVAHNFHFERTLWREVLTGRYGWPEPILEQWDCTMSRARAAGLPGSLDGASRALGAPFTKDAAGQRLMLQMCKPRRVNLDGSIVWWEDEDRMARLSEYCAQDVRVERWLDKRLPPLSGQEYLVWLADARMNDLGVPLDIPFCEAANEVAAATRLALDDEMAELTGGAVPKATNVKALVQWLLTRGIEIAGPEQEEPDVEDEDEEGALPELRRRDVERLLRTVPAGVERRALEIRLEAAKSSTKKVDAMLARAGDDGRVRGMLSFHGAGTGRWSAAGSGIQLQNLPRASVKDWAAAREALDLGHGAVEAIYGPPLDLISRMLRGALCAPEGRQLINADLASVEARGVAWLAGQDDLVARFDQGADVYCDMASEIYGRPVTKANEDERWLGKGVILGCGYGMGWRRFAATCALQGRPIEDSLAEKAVTSYRDTYGRIPALWRKIEQRAKDAVRRDGQIVELDSTGRISFRTWKGWLLMRLPSGRKIFYRNPRLIDDPERGEVLAYDGVNSLTKKWGEQRTHGPRLTENAVQGLCRDIIAEAMLRLSMFGYPPILTVHDEIIAETPEGVGSVEEFVRLLTQRPDWAADFPIAAEGKLGRRYSK